jgi:GTP cyclohydrolase II
MEPLVMPSIASTMTDEFAHVEVERAVAELAAGRAIVLGDHAGAAVFTPVETLDAAALRRWTDETGGARSLVLTRRRARALRLAVAGAGEDRPVVMPLRIDTSVDDIRDLTCPRSDGADMSAGQPAIVAVPAAGDQCDRAAIELLKAACLLPAAVRFAITPERHRRIDALIGDRALLSATAEATVGWRRASLADVVRTGDAVIPLKGCEQVRFIGFRSRLGHREHVAIVVGAPSPADVVTVRLHSACLTGDVFGSLRCDCGEQLQLAVAALAGMGGGVLLYLAQEGRGIGLANKLRAYRLQDDGHDTLDADGMLGFESDERDYAVAGTMLRDLGIGRVRLMTNNPDKLAALTESGIDVVERIPLQASVNPHNHRYLDAKRERARHLLDVPPAAGGSAAA